MILDGSPSANAAVLAQSKDSKSWTAVWDCTRGTFRWNFEVDETVYIVEGSVTVTHGGESTTLRAGDVAFFPAGLHTVWDVDDYVKKIAFLREGRASLRSRLRRLPLLRRAVRAARSVRRRALT